MFVKPTPIGRVIHADEEIEVEKDAVLNHLYQFHYHILNPKDVPMSLKQLSHAAGLSEKRVKDICEILINEKLIKPIPLPHAVFYKITGPGIQFVEKLGH
ncbi:MAG: hypothetical protein HY887_08955 [Deltaproteobacteria bacterium]|nr:hypothetical protein [Deltaproteobacteria bacterium]